ncbi:fructose PTS transporter subunit IIA [Streptococcus ovis]|uniref:fructose PTS transporter subunit IIA n=1 Tax=Streptococcus ovis TaxID=82806 RepID=UPI00036CC8B9|nr:fructose PTS transporter subunit IIA [Streptococcus ovis]
MIDQSLIKVGQVFQSQEEVFQNLSEMIVQEGYATDERAVYEALKLRESEGTTGMMDGFAIPHAKCTAIQRPSVVVLKLDQGVEWQSMDGELIRYVVALFIPEEEAGTTHLKLLSQLARLLIREEFKTAFKTAASPSELESLMKHSLEL